MKNWKPNIFWAITCITIIAVLVVMLAPDYIELIAGGSITGIGMLGMKLLEKDSDGG